MAYLNDHPPRRKQFICPRRADVSGVVVLHSAESPADTSGEDMGAESVARYIQVRDTPGSYHVMCDSDTRIQVVEFWCEAFGDATGSNPHAIHISGAYRIEQWFDLSPAFQDGIIENMALAAVEARDFLRQRGKDLPARIITRAESEARIPGFISHARRDPARRRDPLEIVVERVVGRYRALTTTPEPVPDLEVDMYPTPQYVTTPSGAVWTVAATPTGERGAQGQPIFTCEARITGPMQAHGGAFLSGITARAVGHNEIELNGTGADGNIYFARISPTSGPARWAIPK